MSASTQAVPYTFPAPIGGVPFHSDFVPSIVFAILYALITFVALYRLARSLSRTLCTLGTLSFVIERIVVYSLRAKQAHDPFESASKFLTQYWQTTYAIGYLSILTDIIAVLRSLLVSTTQEMTAGTWSDRDIDSNRCSLDLSEPYELQQQEDQPRARFWYRRICGNLALLSLVPVITGTVAGIRYPNAETDAKVASAVQSLSYATTGIAFGLILIIQILSIWSYFRIPRIRRSGALTTALIATLLNIVSIYRLVVMHVKTTSITSHGPHSLNDTSSKVTFYIFHAAPEFLAAAVLFAVNVREMFSTGLLGDYRSTDKKPTPKSNANPEAYGESISTVSVSHGLP